jgi:GR25 family glycosyltransferase involved in LPS biosynthesis
MFPCYVINLEQDLENFERQKPFLQEEGLDPIRFIGVDARKKEHEKYPELVTPWCQKTCPFTAIGCGLSHVLLAKKLLENGTSMALVLEDDAFPKVCGLQQQIQKTLAETPSDWDMIKLHCSYCVNDSIKSGPASTAAYLLSESGIKKVAEMKVNFHIDKQFSDTKNFKIYKSRWNLFWTDESFSSNRGTNSRILDIKTGLSGEQSLSQSLSYKFFRIGTVEFQTWHALLFLFFGGGLYYLWRQSRK